MLRNARELGKLLQKEIRRILSERLPVMTAKAYARGANEVIGAYGPLSEYSHHFLEHARLTIDVHLRGLRRRYEEVLASAEAAASKMAIDHASRQDMSLMFYPFLPANPNRMGLLDVPGSPNGQMVEGSQQKAAHETLMANVKKINGKLLQVEVLYAAGCQKGPIRGLDIQNIDCEELMHATRSHLDKQLALLRFLGTNDGRDSIKLYFCRCITNDGFLRGLRHVADHGSSIITNTTAESTDALRIIQSMKMTRDLGDAIGKMLRRHIAEDDFNARNASAFTTTGLSPEIVHRHCKVN
ncbi:MAG: hypothetical protein Q9218_007497 [Villophora microphyllina]